MRKQYGRADLMTANNVVAHVPDINDFVGGFEELLSPSGVMTPRVPPPGAADGPGCLTRSTTKALLVPPFGTIKRILNAQGLSPFDVQELSATAAACGFSPSAAANHPETAVAALLERERAAGFERIETYLDFTAKVEASKRSTYLPDRSPQTGVRRSWPTAPRARATPCSTTAACAKI
ncbi:MAG: hypothetical protein R3E96_00030 [Planctomycetota bacterium]